jgi:hypothetical protein
MNQRWNKNVQDNLRVRGYSADSSPVEKILGESKERMKNDGATSYNTA